jgi:hypothetical protein
MVVPYTPSQSMRLLGAMLNPTAENASIPPAVLDWGAVIPGRCSAAWQRDKLEFQERLFDEVAVSMFWLWGANWMDTLFSQLQKAIPGLKNVRTDVGTGIYNGDSLIRNSLTPLERFSKNHRQALTMQGVRSGKTLLSVVSNFLIIALLIPRLNQLKTAWIIKNRYKKTDTLPPHQVANASRLSLGNENALVQQATHAQQAFGYLNTAKAVMPDTAALPGSTVQPRFSGNPLENTLKALEVIKSTDYGYILTGDGAMLAGRSYSAFTRPDVSRKDTMGEVREILWRDAVSSYLYLWGIPHITRLASAVIQPFWRSETRLEPMVGHMLVQQLQPLLNRLTGPVSQTQLKQWWQGQPVDQAIKDQWREQLGRVHQPQRFWSALAADMTQTLGKPQWQQVEHTLRETAPHSLSADQLGSWLQHTANTLKSPINADVVRSIKRAFAQTAGLPLSTAQAQLLPMLAPAQQAAAQQRLARQASHHTRQQLADTWQLALQQSGLQDLPLNKLDAKAPAMFNTLQDLGQHLDKQALGHQPLISEPFKALPGWLNAMAQHQPPERADLFKQLAKQAQHLLSNPMVRQLENHPDWMTDAITYMTTGAARHNPQLIQQAMALVGIAPDDYRQEVNPAKLKKLLANMDAFWTHMTGALPAETLQSGPATLAKLQTLAKTRNMWPRYVTLAAGVLGSMISLGIVVPKIQYWITKKTTGRNEQPALAALRQRYGLAQPE